ncbi:UNVERIFIED_CONTAM: hypothetical protein HHA_450180 [Hammondia hammondi]|eukprot:XP_008889111.1 hypothetical protein HHA_450180 [Hammondia hammondi]
MHEKMQKYSRKRGENRRRDSQQRGSGQQRRSLRCRKADPGGNSAAENRKRTRKRGKKTHRPRC